MGSRSVLVVDDCEPLRELIATALEVHGQVVVGQAEDGVEAVLLASEVLPDVIVIDEDMPNLAGAEAIPLLRIASPSSRIVVFSAEPQPPGQADAYLTKDAGLPELIDLVDRIDLTAV